MKISKIIAYLGIVIVVIGGGLMLKDLLTQGLNANTQQSIGKAVMTIGFLLLLIGRVIPRLTGRRR